MLNFKLTAAEVAHLQPQVESLYNEAYATKFEQGDNEKRFENELQLELMSEVLLWVEWGKLDFKALWHEVEKLVDSLEYRASFYPACDFDRDNYDSPETPFGRTLKLFGM